MKDDQKTPLHWSRSYTFRLDFKGTLLHSIDVKETIKSELSPTMDDFKIIKVLGKGAIGKVYQCAYEDNCTNDKYAMKIMELKKSDDIDAFNNQEPREVLIMSCLKEPSVVTFYQAWTAKDYYVSELDEDGDKYQEASWEQSDDSESDLQEPLHVIIQMENCIRTVEDISSIGKCEINMEKAWTLFEKITEAVECIHQNGVIHRDLKPGNIFIGKGGEVKIGDFGHSCWADSYTDGKEGTPDRGTHIYAAPELYLGQVTYKVDVYSLGIIYLEIFHPFGSGSEES